MIIPHGKPCHVVIPNRPLGLAFRLKNCTAAELWLTYRVRPKRPVAELERATAAVPMELQGDFRDQQWRTVRPMVCAAPPAVYDICMVCAVDGAPVLAAAADCMVVAQSIAL